MTIISMVFKKCYLLAGIMLAANIFVVNEVKAMNEQRKEELLIENNSTSSLAKKIGKVCEWENTINFTVGSALSLANNYFKWWDYNKGGYWKCGCLGWRSGRFLKDCFQFDVNLNIGRGILWSVLWGVTMIKTNPNLLKTVNRTISVLIRELKKWNKGNKAHRIAWLTVTLVQGFVSMPLVIHISTFDFTIALDSLIWVGVYMALEKRRH